MRWVDFLWILAFLLQPAISTERSIYTAITPVGVTKGPFFQYPSFPIFPCYIRKSPISIADPPSFRHLPIQIFYPLPCSVSLFPSTNPRILNNQMKQYILDKKASQSTNSPTGKPKDILDLALSDPDYGSSASTSELIDQLKTFFFAGHDTTASTISWTYYFLSHSPPSLLLLRKELDSIFGQGSTPQDVASQLINDPKTHTRLDYTLAVIKESLRLEPPGAPAREIPRDYIVKTRSGAEYAFPEGTMVYLSAWLLHRNRHVWGDDAREFKPERFLPGKHVPWGYVPFSKRPRDCIGSNLAYLEVENW
jgi:cytochrome P450